jgi:hypothetical protein
MRHATFFTPGRRLVPYEITTGGAKIDELQCQHSKACVGHGPIYGAIPQTDIIVNSFIGCPPMKYYFWLLFCSWFVIQ